MRCRRAGKSRRLNPPSLRLASVRAVAPRRLHAVTVPPAVEPALGAADARLVVDRRATSAPCSRDPVPDLLRRAGQLTLSTSASQIACTCLCDKWEIGEIDSLLARIGRRHDGRQGGGLSTRRYELVSHGRARRRPGAAPSSTPTSCSRPRSRRPGGRSDGPPRGGRRRGEHGRDRRANRRRAAARSSPSIAWYDTRGEERRREIAD